MRFGNVESNQDWTFSDAIDFKWALVDFHLLVEEPEQKLFVFNVNNK